MKMFISTIEDVVWVNEDATIILSSDNADKSRDAAMRINDYDILTKEKDNLINHIENLEREKLRLINAVEYLHKKLIKEGRRYGASLNRSTISALITELKE